MTMIRVATGALALASFFFYPASAQAKGFPIESEGTLPEREPECHYEWDLTIIIPCEMEPFIKDVWFGCESKDAYLAGDPSTAVGKFGERGAAQIHPVHIPTMLAMGLNFFLEHDRILYGIHLYITQGPAPWTCSKIMGYA